MRRSSRFFCYSILFFTTVVIKKFTTEEGFYMPLIILMGIAPLLYLRNRRKMDTLDKLVAVTFVTMVLFSYAFNYQHVKITSLMYTGMYMTTFLAYKSIVQRDTLSIRVFVRIIRSIIYLYAIFLFIQQIQVTLGFYPINHEFTTNYAGGYKLNAASMEPSHTVIIIPFLLFSFIRCMEIVRGEERYRMNHAINEDFATWFLSLYVCLSCGSMSVVFTVPILLLYFIRFRYVAKYLVLATPLALIVYFVLANTNSELIERTQGVITTLIADKNSIVDFDKSAACRIIPFVEYFSRFDFANFQTWFGHGQGELERICSYVIVFDEDASVGAAGLCNFLYDFGLITGVLFLYFVVKAICQKWFDYEFVMFLLMVSVVSVNVYILWGFLIFLYTTNYYFKKNERYGEFKQYK